MLNYTTFEKAKRRANLKGKIVRKKDFEREYLLESKPIPLFESLKREDQVKLISDALEKRTRKLCRDIRKDVGNFLGRKAILNQKSTGVFPKQSNKTNRPLCYTKSISALKAFREEYFRLLETYKEASRKYRLGLRNIELPPNCFYSHPSHSSRIRFSTLLVINRNFSVLPSGFYISQNPHLTFTARFKC